MRLIVNNKTFATIVALVLTGSAAAQQGATVPDGTWSGTYSCGAILIPNARSPQGFSLPISMKTDGRKVTIRRDTEFATDSLWGTAGADGDTVLTGGGHRIDVPSAEGYRFRFNGRFTGQQFHATGLVESINGKTKYRDCQLDLSLESGSVQTTLPRTAESQPVVQAQQSAPPIVTRQPHASTSTSEVVAPVSRDTATGSDKAAFLAAAKRGDLIDIPTLTLGRDAVFAPTLGSITRILQDDYAVPPLPRVTACDSEYQSAVKRFIRAATQVHTTTLSDRPPDFKRTPNDGGLNDVVSQMSRAGGYCESTGTGQPHPYKVALSKLMDEYSKATSEYVEAERSRRKAAYADQMARTQFDMKAAADAKAKRDADARATEQKRIDSERQRIEADQKRRQQQEKNRVAG